MAKPLRILAAVATAITILASCAPAPPGGGDPDTVVFVVGDSGASLAGHPGLTILGNASPLPGYVPWGWGDDLHYFPGYHASGYVNAALAERGFDNSLVVPRAVWGSHGEDWVRADQPVCSPAPAGQDPRCGKSPNEIAAEIAQFRASGTQVIIWFSIGVAPVAHTLSGDATSIAWSDTAAWNQRLAAERSHVENAISILQGTGTPPPAGSPDPVVILPGYANLSGTRPSALLGIPCGAAARSPFQLFQAGITHWDAMVNPLLTGGGTDLYDGGAFLGASHPTGVSGMLADVAAGDPNVAHVNPGLALVADPETADPWAPSPDAAIKPDCVHLSSTGAEGLVNHVLDGTLPQLGLGS